MRNIKLTIEYDGTNYHGWQSQDNAVTVQDIVIEAIKKITCEECDLIGSSRTDTGVHALGMAANFTTNAKIPVERFPHALNSVLPDDVIIKNAEEVSSEFHARYWAKGKKYRYLFYNSIYRSALLRNRAFHIKHPLDLERMKEAAKYLLGTHDFSAFRSSGSDTKTSVRTIKEVSLFRQNEIVTFEIAGDGFLYNMVRIIAGTLVEVGTGRMAPDEVKQIIEQQNRKKAGRTAPAHGLYLVEVYY